MSGRTCEPCAVCAFRAYQPEVDSWVCLIDKLPTRPGGCSEVALNREQFLDRPAFQAMIDAARRLRANAPAPPDKPGVER